MIRSFLTLLGLIITGYLFAQIEPSNGSRASQPAFVAFTNAHIVISPEKSIEDGTLLIEGDKILEVGKIVKIPSNAIIVDCEGMTILPSFIELNSSIGLPKATSTSQWNPRPQIESSKEGAYYWNESIHPETHASLLFKTDEKAAEELQKMGFGASLTHFSDGISRGTGALIALSEATENELILKSNAAQVYSFEKGVSKQTYPSSQMGSIALLRQVFYDLNWYTKSQDKQSNLSLDAMNSAMQLQLPFLFKTNDKWEILRANKIAKEFGYQFHYFGSGNEYMALKSIKATDATIVIPINFPEAYDVKDPYISRQIPLSDLKHWELAPSNPFFLASEKIPFCISSAGNKSAESFWSNLRKSIQRGLSPQAALKALTVEPATLIGALNELGTLEPGKKANFTIYSADPFQKEAKLYESWSLGKCKRFGAPNKEDVAGKYNLFLNEKKYPLEITLSGEKYTGKVTTFKDKNVESSPNNIDTIFQKATLFLNGNDLTLQFNIDDKNWKGSVNLHAKTNAKLGILEGDGQLPDGQWIQWSAIRNQKGELSKESVKNSSVDSLYTPKIWFPNMAYGFDSLPQKSIVLYTNATVWTNETQGILYNANVLVENGKISYVGPEKPKNTENVKIIDAKGKHLTSGVIDEHSHIAISKGVNEGGQAISAEVSIGDVVNPDDINIYRQLSGGVTAAQLLHGSANPIGGQSALIKLKWGTDPEEMLIDNAPKFIKCALGENVKQANWGDYNTERFPQTRMGVEQVFYDGFSRAKVYQKDWEDYKKGGKHHKSPPRKDLELDVLGEIIRSERFITCHSYVQSEINMLMHVADSMGFKINTFTHILEGYKVADKMLQHGVGASTFSDWWAYKFEVNDAIPYNAALMTKMGLVVAINSDDAEMGRRLNQEAAKGIKYGGMTEEEAWKMVTLNPAKLLHLDDRMGSVKVGKDADLVLWSDNPLSIQAKVEKTMIEGVFYYEASTENLMRASNQKEKARIISKMLESNENGETSKPFQKQKSRHFHCDTLGEEGSEEENMH